MTNQSLRERIMEVESWSKIERSDRIAAIEQLIKDEKRSMGIELLGKIIRKGPDITHWWLSELLDEVKKDTNENK